MSSKKETPQGEHQKIDPQKLWKKMTTMPDTSGVLRKTLGSDNVRSFFQILTSSEAVEADWLYLCGDLTNEQAHQYALVSGNLFSSLKKLGELAKKMEDEFKPRLIDLVEKDIRGQKKEGAFNLFQTLVDLCDVGDMLKEQHLLPASQPVDMNALALQLKKAGFKGSAVEHFGSRFQLELMGMLGCDLIEIAINPKTNENIRKKISELVDLYQRVYKNGIGIDFPGRLLFSEKSSDKMLFEKKENVTQLDHVINFSGALDEQERQKISEENKKLFSMLSKEALYKKIPFLTLNDSNPQIIAIRDVPDSVDQYAQLCALRINFGPKSVSFPPLLKDKIGNTVRDYNTFTGIVECNISPATGEICFVTSVYTGGIPLKDQVISSDRYLALQNFILRKINEYLESKEPDIEDLFAYSPEELKVRNQRIEAEARLKQPDAVEEPMLESMEESVIEPKRYVPQMETAEVQELAEGKFVLPKHFRTAVMDRISGAKAEAVIAALRRMLGKEEKVEGSHLIFRSDRNGIAMPVPLHSQKDRHHISLGLILSNLKQWQYDPIELAMELGLKVPKRFMSET